MTSAFSWQNSISLCPASFRIPRVHCILFTHSSVDGHLSCFHFGTIMNNTAVNMSVWVFVWTHFHFSWVYTWEELLGHIGSLYLTCWGTARLFSKVTAPFSTLSTISEDSNFSVSSPTLAIAWHFDCSHPSGYEVTAYCDFDLHLSVSCLLICRFSCSVLQ